MVNGAPMPQFEPDASPDSAENGGTEANSFNDVYCAWSRARIVLQVLAPLETQNALRVAMKNLFHQLIGVP